MAAETRDAPPLPSDRSVGLLFAVVSGGVGTWQWWVGRGAVGIALCALALGFVAVSLVRPGLLRPLNRAWMKLAELMHRVVSPIVLGLMFFVLITPIAFAMRIAKRDELNRHLQRGAGSYWKRREPAGPGRDSFPRQY